MKLIFNEPELISQTVDQFENKDCLLQKIKYQANQEKIAERFITVCRSYQEPFPGFIQYLEVEHDEDNMTIHLRLNYLDHFIPLNSLLDNPKSCISVQLILNVLFRLVDYFSQNIQNKMFNTYFFNADCVLFTQASESYQTLFLVQISCFPMPDTGNNYQDQWFNLCVYENALNESQIVSALLELVNKFSQLTNVILLEEQIIFKDTRVTKFQQKLTNLAKEKLKTFNDLSDKLEKIRQDLYFQVNVIQLSELIGKCLNNSHKQQKNAADQSSQDYGTIPYCTTKVQQFVSLLANNFHKLITDQFGSKANQNNRNEPITFTKKYQPVLEVNGNILKLERENFYCEVLHMVILNSFLESTNQGQTQLTNSTMYIRNSSYFGQSFFRKNLSMYYDYGRQKNKLYWVYVGILIHFVNYALISEDLMTSLLIVLNFLEDAYEQPQDKEDDFMLQYLTQSFRYHLANVAKYLNDKYLEKTSKYFQLSKGIQNDENSKMIGFDEAQSKISLPKKLLDFLPRNEKGEICFTVPVKEENFIFL